MILGFFPEMLIGGVLYGIGRSYNKPWARVVGGGLMIVTTAWTVVNVALVYEATKYKPKPDFGPNLAGDSSLFK